MKPLYDEPPSLPSIGRIHPFGRDGSGGRVKRWELKRDNEDDEKRAAAVEAILARRKERFADQ